MRSKRLSLLFLAIALLFTAVAPQTAGASTMAETEKIIQKIEILKQKAFDLKFLLLNLNSQKQIDSPSYLALNISNNSAILKKNPDCVYPIASLTKLMAAVITLENIDNNRTITLTEKMLEPEGQSSSLFPGLNISAENLLKASLIQSSNDASEALSYFMEKDKFVVLMNGKAKEIGMTNTFFYDIHGLSPVNYSTAADLAKLIIYINKNHPEILKITKDDDFWLPDQSGKMLKFQNLNSFFSLATFVGGKTGYLDKAKQTLASVFDIKGKPVAIIVLSSKNHQADAFGILEKLGVKNP